MTYCTKQDLIDRFGEKELTQLTDRTNTPASVIDDAVVSRAIADADALIDGYVGKAYSLPLAEVPPTLVKLSADIARYFLHSRGVEKDSPVQRAYDQAIGFLRDVSKGLVKLVEETSGLAPKAAGNGGVQVVAQERIFSRQTLRGY
jgi:phage gp36-like protein